MAQSPDVRLVTEARLPALAEELELVTDAELRRQLPALAEELGIGATGVPIFATLAEAEEWEAANPGKKALTLEASTPDTTAPTWPAGAAMSVVKTDVTATLNLTQLAADDRGVTGYDVSLDSGSTWIMAGSPRLTFDAAAKSIKVSGLTASTPYPAPRVRAKDAAGNLSAALVAGSGFTTDAEPPNAYLTTAKNSGALYVLANSRTNLGSAGPITTTFIGETQANASAPKLAGITPMTLIGADSAKKDFAWQTGGSPMLGATKFSYSVMIRLTATKPGYNDSADFVKFMGAPRSVLPNTAVAPTAPDGTPVDYKFGDTVLIPAAPTALSETHLFGVDYDGATATLYLDGKVFKTVTASITLATNVGYLGLGAGSTYSRTPSTYDWAGLVIHNAPLGASTHAQLAKDAGVYVA